MPLVQFRWRVVAGLALLWEDHQFDCGATCFFFFIDHIGFQPFSWLRPKTSGYPATGMTVSVSKYVALQWTGKLSRLFPRHCPHTIFSRPPHQTLCCSETTACHGWITFLGGGGWGGGGGYCRFAHSAINDWDSLQWSYCSKYSSSSTVALIGQWRRLLFSVTKQNRYSDIELVMNSDGR